MLRLFVALAAAAALALIPLGSASASSTTAKRIAYVSATDLWTIAANGTGTTNLGENPANVSFSSDGQLIVFDDGVDVRSISSSGPADSSVFRCAGTDPAISPDKTKVAYVFGARIRVDPLSCGAASALVPGSTAVESAPAWSPDGTQIVFVSDGDLAVAPSAGGAAQKLGTTSGVPESDPAWSPDGAKIAYIAGSELFVMNADGSNRQQLTSNGITVVESSPSWAPGGDEIVYATTPGGLYVAAANGSSTRQLSEAGPTASRPDWGLAVANKDKPTITPSSGLTDGIELSAGATDTWTSVSAITSRSYQWKRCSSGGTGCINLAGANAGTYTLTSSDIGSTIRLVVTATTPDGSAPGTSDATSVVVAASPKNVIPPTISGTAIIGGTLTASPGTWTGSNIVFTYQWQKCDSAGTEASCANISGATNNVFVPQQSEVGSTLRVLVTGTNGVNPPATKASNPTAIVASNIPANTSLPAIALSTSVFDESTSFVATTGVWTGAPTITFRYQWRRCNANGASCIDIAAATTSSYTPVAADIGSRLRVAVTATNSYGSATAVSEPTEVLTGKAPINSFPPSISGEAETGSVLTSTNGTWTGSLPITYTYEWRRCNSAGTACSPIAGGTSQSYIVQSADVGARIVLAVTAKNLAGTATAVSPPTHVVTVSTTPTASVRPSVIVSPSFTGVLARGQTLTARNGTWSGTTPMIFSYRWQRCPAAGTACTSISLATRSTYVLAAADVGKRIRLAVTAANAAGSTEATSPISKVVGGKSSSPSGRRINGTAKADKLVGGPGPDTIRGGAGNDTIYGGSGDDRITPGTGRDRVFGGAGNDTILASDKTRDAIDCGGGNDSVTADKVDVLRHCERAKRR